MESEQDYFSSSVVHKEDCGAETESLGARSLKGLLFQPTSHKNHRGTRSSQLSKATLEAEQHFLPHAWLQHHAGEGACS